MRAVSRWNARIVVCRWYAVVPSLDQNSTDVVTIKGNTVATDVKLSGFANGDKATGVFQMGETFQSTAANGVVTAASTTQLTLDSAGTYTGKVKAALSGAETVAVTGTTQLDMSNLSTPVLKVA